MGYTPYQEAVLDKLGQVVDAAQAGVVLFTVVSIVVLFLLSFVAVSELRS